MAHSTSRAVAFAWVAVAYAVAGVVAWLVWMRFGVGRPAWQAVALADAAATVAVFVFSVAFDNSSFYDPYWSVAPMVIAPALAAGAGGALTAAGPSAGAPFARKALVVVLVLAWGARLTYNWARGWQGLAHEDWRYADKRGMGRAYWAVSFVGFHFLPTIWVYLGCLSLLPALVSGTHPLGVLDVVALAVTAGAIALETVADEQLRAFRLGSPEPGRILATGVWAYVRHPNYLGEMTFWWGLYLFALAADPGAWGAIAGPLSITLLFAFISVPIIDARSLKRRARYAEHMARVPALFPRLFGRRGA